MSAANKELGLVDHQRLPSDLNEDSRFKNPVSQYGQTIKKMINSCYSMVQREVASLQNDPIYGKVMVDRADQQHLKDRGFVVDMCGERNFICYSRRQNHLRIQVFVSLEQDTYDDWLREYAAKRDRQALEMLNLKDMHLQFSSGGNLSRSVSLTRNRAVHVRRHGAQREEALHRDGKAEAHRYLP
jgi:hypothetical protein